ncbi:MAG: enoyl-CoA hydratase/isomerase family protein [Phycisphaerales bacterium]
MSDLVLVHTDDGVATVTMNRPEKRNALSIELIEALEQVIEAIERDDSVRAMILSGEGKAFCAGMDLQGVMADAVGMRRMLHGLSRVLRRIRRLPVPTIAKVQGAAVGGGCGLMVVTDFAITHPEAKVGYPEVSLGLCPAVVAPWLMRKIGPGRARAMLLSGGTVSGREGFELGLASHLADRDRLDAEAATVARSLAEGGVLATRTTKSWLNELDGSLEDAVLDRAAELSADVIASEEAQARLRALFGRDRVVRHHGLDRL